ncbi:hypothetical protein, partial [Mycoplasmopsis bovis]
MESTKNIKNFKLLSIAG